jgi:hypothetical protein
MLTKYFMHELPRKLIYPHIKSSAAAILENESLRDLFGVYMQGRGTINHMIFILCE